MPAMCAFWCGEEWMHASALFLWSLSVTIIYVVEIRSS